MKRETICSDWKYRLQGEETWQKVRLPHDAMLHQKRSADCPSGSACAFYPGGVYEYERTLEVPAQWEGKYVALQFEGVYRNARVLVNGKEAGFCAYGYIPFFVEIGKYLNYGGSNKITVVADNSKQPNSRWYSGGGIYRPVHLWVGEESHIAPEGIKITTTSINPPAISVKVEAGKGDIEMEILDGGKSIETAFGNDVVVELPGAQLWSEDSPKLYQCHVVLKDDGAVVDEATVSFGIRQLTWSAKGFFVNGKETLLRGGCVHHDNGVTGGATFAESEWRRVRLLKEAGYNAIRSSHNPASEAMLEACDALGMYVMDETWDMWYKLKTKYDYHIEFPDNYKKDLKAFVDRGFNHPSIVMYSIGNEISEPATQKGVDLAREMTEYLHELDGSRPVTAGVNLMIITQSKDGKGVYDNEEGRDTSAQEKKMNGMNSTVFNMITSMVGTSMNKAGNSKKADEATTPVLDVLDICGYNYGSGRYPLEKDAHPERILVGSETFPQTIAQNWKMVKEYPYLIGDFMWTSWDYLGEAGIGAWAYTEDGKGFDKPYPWKLGDVGALDILGTPNAHLFWAQAAWDLLKAPAIAVMPANHGRQNPAKAAWRGTNGMPSWSFRGCDGTKTNVEVFTQGAAVELYVNGSKVGKKKVKDCRALFKNVKYEPGEVKAVAFDAAGSVIGESRLVSAQSDVKLRLALEQPTMETPDVWYVDVTLADGKGVVECNADTMLTVAVEGGELIGFGSANPRTESEFIDGRYETYYGRAQAVIRKTAEKTVLKVSDGKDSAQLEF